MGQFFPTPVNDGTYTRELAAERIALRRLFETALDCRCEVTLRGEEHPGAFQILSDWAAEHGICPVSTTYEATTQCRRFTVYTFTLGNESTIKLFMVHK